MTIRTIGVLGHVGNGNLGDEAIMAATFQNIREQCPGAAIRAFTIVPEDTEARHGVPSFPLRRVALAAAEDAGPAPVAEEPGVLGRVLAGTRRAALTAPFLRGMLRALRAGAQWPGDAIAELRFLVESHRRLRGVDMLIVAGSGQINDDWGGVRGFPYTLFKWSLLCRAAGTKFVFLSVGATALRSPVSRFLTRRALMNAAYRSYRDPGSKSLLTPFAPVEHDPVVPDLAFSLRATVDTAAEDAAARPVVAINPMTLYDGTPWPTTSREVYQRYVEAVAALVEWLLQRGYAVRLFTTMQRVDRSSVEDILLRLGDPSLVEVVPPLGPEMQHLSAVIEVLSAADFVVATRFHGILLGLNLAKPVLAISYQRKTRELMENMGQGAYVVDAAHCTFDELAARFTALEENRSSAAAELLPLVRANREVLDDQYARVVGLLG
jgi:polysaccharide pyruvyl transferase WcaK-like protein